MGLPFGTATLYQKLNRNVKRQNAILWKENCSVFEKSKSKQQEASVITKHPKLKWTKSMHGQESIFCQFASLVAFPKAIAVFSAYHAGPGQLVFGSSQFNGVDFAAVERIDNDEGGFFHRITLLNYHGLYYHNEGLHIESCPQFDAHQDKRKGSIWWYQEQSRFVNDLKDSMKKDLARALSDERIHFVYKSVYECQLFHHCLCPDPGILNSFGTQDPSALERIYSQNINSMGQYLTMFHSHRSIVSKTPTSISQKDLIRNIVNQYQGKSNDHDLYGFILIRGGNTDDKKPLNEKGLPSEAFHFCHQRTRLTEDDLGPFTLFQSKLYEQTSGVKAENYLKNQLHTVLKDGFDDDGEGELLGTDYLAFLIVERDFKNFTIDHFIHYERKNFLTPFITKLLQDRYDLKKSKNPDLLLSNTLKLILNGFYGFSSIEQTNFKRTKFNLGSTLKKKNSKTGIRNYQDARINSLIFMGFKKVKKDMDFIYAVTRNNDGASIFNAVQISCCILSASRVMFLSKLLYILRVCDPGKVELAYWDTDSYLLSSYHKNFRNLILPRLKNRKNEIIRKLFEDPHSDREQSSLLKVEGVFKLGIFKCCKCYLLEHPVHFDKESLFRENEDESTDEEEAEVMMQNGRIVRMKSVSKKLHGLLKYNHYGQNPQKSIKIAHCVVMRPSKDMRVHMQTDSKTLGHAMNFKRRAVVNCFFFKKKMLHKVETFFLFF